ncbi:unnamed protein product [Moneuplotes crassus]|uniref:Fibronectin type-III domain-containing protein n=1 Tax=Euplotes crassus TaxID=5936 RepID=A0AAD1UK23_EUPCR|nr:unnamed protein product [Moneuplotes crassus]
MEEEVLEDSHWTGCTDVPVGRQRHYVLSGLDSRSTYRVRVMHSSDFGDTDWSPYKIYLTAIEETKEVYKRAEIFAKGTSAVNHGESVIMVDGNIILQKANYRGLYLVVLDRKTLAKTDSAIGVSSITEKLGALDGESIIVIVSNNVWEDDFSIELGNQLQKFGGFYIKEFQYQYSRRFSEHTRSRHLKFEDISEQNNYFHPFAFIGIKGIPPGMAYESIRSNQGYFLEESAQPQAELNVFLEYNIMTHRYVFDQIQVESEMRMNEDYKVIHKNKNRSLMNIIQYLASVNLTVAVDALESGFQSTYYDKSILVNSEIPQRLYENNSVVVAGVDLKTKPYYTYLQNFVHNDGRCEAPYTDYTNSFCYDLSTLGSDIPDIFKCKIGLMPYNCPAMADIENSFSGYF